MPDCTRASETEDLEPPPVPIIPPETPDPDDGPTITDPPDDDTPPGVGDEYPDVDPDV